jgi:hypothetical protein
VALLIITSYSFLEVHNTHYSLYLALKCWTQYSDEDLSEMSLVVTMPVELWRLGKFDIRRQNKCTNYNLYKLSKDISEPKYFGDLNFQKRWEITGKVCGVYFDTVKNLARSFKLFLRKWNVCFCQESTQKVKLCHRYEQLRWRCGASNIYIIWQGNILQRHT